MSTRLTGFVLTLSVTCALAGSEASAQFCFSDGDCPAATPRCRQLSCVECLDDNDCGGMTCGSNGACISAPPPAGCVDDSQCDEWEECVGSVCRPRETTEPSVCGDGIVQDDEQCDDANTKDGDGCNRCIQEYCGDGIVQPRLGEECDYAINTSDCTTECKRKMTCGDGIWQRSEQCEVGVGGWTEYSCNAPTCTRRKIVKAGSPNIVECDHQQLDTCFPSCFGNNECENLPDGYEVCIGGTFCTYDCSGSHECPQDMHCEMFGEQYGCAAN